MSATLRRMIRGFLASAVLVAVAAAVASPGTGRASGAGAVRLKVVTCPTVYGLPRNQYKIPAVRSSLSASVTAPLAGRVSFYSNGWLSVLAPRGWHCAGVVAATGALDLDVLPPGSTDRVVIFRLRGPGGFSRPGLPSQDMAVTARIPSPDTGEVPGTACAFFPETIRLWGNSCWLLPSQEHVDRLSADAVAFEDPAYVFGSGDPSGGRYPANGLVMYSDLKAAQETCTLPQTEHSVCTAILDDFLARDRP
jgi:hypothetical protein